MSPSSPDFSDPASVVTALIRQMHDWEALAGSLSGGAQARFRPDDGSTLHPEETRLSKLLGQIPAFIVAVYLTKRPKGYEPSVSYSIPPEYDPRTEKVKRVVPKTKSQVIVETDRKADYMGGIREYVLKSQDGLWLIDNVSTTLLGKKRKVTLV
jgi:hypothetical protein